MKNKERNSKDDDLKDMEFEDRSCEGISPEHCEHLKELNFSNNPLDLFSDVRLIEDRYKNRIREEKDKIKKEIEEAKKKYGLKYETALKNKYKEIDFHISELKAKMQKNSEMLEKQEQKILSEIDMIYKLKARTLIDKGFKIIGLDF